MTDSDSLPTSKKEFRELDPYYFEQLIAVIWEKLGYDTTVRSGSHDRGIDVEARSDDKTELTLIQAKRHRKSNKIGSQDVREYATLYQQKPDADDVIIVTTSSFTTEAKKLGNDLDVTLVDMNILWKIYYKIRSEGESENSDKSNQDAGSDANQPAYDTKLNMVEIKTDLIPVDKISLKHKLVGKAVELNETYEYYGKNIEIIDIRPQHNEIGGIITESTDIRFS